MPNNLLNHLVSQKKKNASPIIRKRSRDNDKNEDSFGIIEMK